MPKPPLVVLESQQLAEILNYQAEDRELLEAQICDFNINVECNIPYSGSVRIERNRKIQHQKDLAEKTKSSLKQVYAQQEERNSDVMDITDHPILLTEMGDLKIENLD